MGVISGFLRNRDSILPDFSPQDLQQLSSGRITLCSSSDFFPPFSDPVSGCAAVLAGRLDNRSDLQRLLKADPTATDAELIVRAYLQWQLRLPDQLAGEFAIALWDPRAATLLLARDPFGFQPLYYSIDTNCILFASFPESIPPHPTSSHELNEECVLWYLYDGTSAPGRKTFFRDVEFLPGGHALIASPSSVGVSRYFVLPEQPEGALLNLEDAKEELREKLNYSIACRLKNESRVGVFLSGGVDSSSLAVMAARMYPGRVTAYSGVFDHFDTIDERKYSCAVTEMHSIPHRLVNADDCITLESFENHIPRFVDPFLTPYEAWQTKLLLHSQQDGCQGILMGIGGDHLFNGSARFAADWLLSGKWKALSEQMRFHSRMWNHSWLHSFAANAIFPFMPSSLQSHLEAKKLPDLRRWQPASLRSRTKSLPIPPPVHRGKNAWWYQIRSILASFGQLPFCHLQRVFHAHGQKLLAPFNDPAIARLVLQVSPDCLYRNGLPKYLLRESLHDLLPPLVRDRTTKGDFSPLLREGLRMRQAWLESLLNDSELARRGYVEPQNWRSDMLSYIHGKTPPYWAYWRSLMLELWLRHRSGRLSLLAA